MNECALAKTIDHTLLSPHATAADIDRLCAEAKAFEFASVCVLPSRVRQAAQALKDSPVKVCTVIGFPLGANSTQVKLQELRLARQDGAHEFDMVVNLGDVKDGNWKDVEAEILLLRDASLPDGILKVIVETGLLTQGEKVLLSRMCARTQVDFIKTSTGSTYGGATTEDVALMAKEAGPNVQVKASGGIKTAEDALAMLHAGATRLGTSHGLAILGVSPSDPRRHTY